MIILIVLLAVLVVACGLLINSNLNISKENEQLIVRNRWYSDMDRRNSDVYHQQCREIKTLKNRRHRCSVFNTSCCDTTGDNLKKVTDQ